MKGTAHQKILLCTILIASLGCQAQEVNMNTISKNGMKVSWRHTQDRVFFETSAPTDGWVTIGFNTHSGTKGAYLIMGNVVKGKVNIVEHYTLSHGNYKSVSALGASSQVKNIAGYQNTNTTILEFSLPIKPLSKYQKNLSKGKNYTIILAYSQEDDFLHHSIMRTSINVKL